MRVPRRSEREPLEARGSPRSLSCANGWRPARSLGRAGVSLGAQPVRVARGLVEHELDGTPAHEGRFGPPAARFTPMSRADEHERPNAEMAGLGKAVEQLPFVRAVGERGVLNARHT